MKRPYDTNYAYNYFVILINDLLFYISLLISPFDFINLSLTCKTNHSLLIPLYDKIQQLYLNEKKLLMLKHMEKKSISFILNILSHENKSFIAGSFPLYFISNSCYRYNDIDIYLQWDNYKNYDNEVFPILNDKYFKNTIYENTKNFCYTINDDTPSYDERIVKYSFIKSIKLILTVFPKDYKGGEDTSTTLQFLFIKNNLNDMGTYIKNNFDLSFCKCWFDSKNLKCETNNFLNILKRTGVINLNIIQKRMDNYSLIVKKHNIKELYIGEFVLPRLLKYQERGFNIKNSENFKRFYLYNNMDKNNVCFDIISNFGLKI